MTKRAFAGAILAVLMADPLAGQQANIERIIDFGVDAAGDWFAVNDGVMGGRSSSRLTAGVDGIAVFEGSLSLENNGGFVSVRSQVIEAALAGTSRFVLRVRGDGKRYQLRLRPDRRFDGIAFAASFETTAGEWSIIELPLSSFEPTFRGRRPAGVGPLDPAQIGQVSIMLTDRQEGAFRLEIDWIGVDRSDRPR